MTWGNLDSLRVASHRGPKWRPRRNWRSAWWRDFPGGCPVSGNFGESPAVTVTNASEIVEVMQFVKAELGFDLLLDVSGVDHFGKEPRFEVVYHLYGMGTGAYLRVKTPVGEETPELPTVSGLWKGRTGHEREVFDLMGIRFLGHPDLRRINHVGRLPALPVAEGFPARWPADR